MPENHGLPDASGTVSTIASLAGAGLVAGIAWALKFLPVSRRQQEATRQEAVDRQRELSDAVIARDLARLEGRLAAAEADAELWERRARRIDREAHNLWHLYVNSLPVNAPKPAPLPFLEDPF